MPVAARLWAAAFAISCLVLPWYGQERLWQAVLDGQARPLLAEIPARLWLLPMLAAPALALHAAWGNKPRLMVLAGLVGLAWLGIEGFAITHRGWGWPWLGAILGGTPSQPALGWGALLYALAGTMLTAIGLARQGWCRGDAFVLSSILLILGAILLFVFWPVMTVLVSAFRDNQGGFAPALFAEKFTDRSIWGLECLSGVLTT